MELFNGNDDFIAPVSSHKHLSMLRCDQKLSQQQGWQTEQRDHQ